MQLTETLQTQQVKMQSRRKISGHNIFPTHNGALSHVAAFGATLGIVVYSSSNSKGSENEVSLITKHLGSTIRFVHLLTFATWLGVQVWVHVSGRAS